MAKKEKPPKVKKEKPPKVKKEKPPKVKKEKPPKVKKTKAAKGKRGPDIADGQVENLLTGEMEGGDGKKKGGKKKLLLILIPIVVLAAAGGVLVFTGVLGGKGDIEEPEIVDTAGEEPSGEGGGGTGTGEPGEAGEGEDAGEAGDAAEEEPPVPNSGRYLTDIQSNLTTADIVTYMSSLSPAVLGLEGTDMTGYEVYPSEGVTLVDGLTCSRVQVYSRGEQSGTNDVEGVYYITRSGARRLYRYDTETGIVTEVELPRPTPAPTPEPGEGEEGETAEEEEP